MAHVVSLWDGTTTVPLSTTNAILSNYTPQAPDMGEGGLGGVLDGETIGDVYYRAVTEPVELYLYAASKTALQTAVRAIEIMLEKAARRRSRRAGPRVYLVVQVDGETGYWRSEILAGKLELAQNALAVYANVGFEARLFVTRRPYFEYAGANLGDDPTELSISSSVHTARTGGVTITNTNDANYIQIAAAQVTGSLPAPIKLDIENDNAQDHIHTNVWVINNAYANPTAADIWRLGSESVGASATLTVGAGANGQAVNMRWLLPASLVDACSGGYVRALLTGTGIEYDGQMRGVVEYGKSDGYSQQIWGPLVEVDAQTIDLGVFPIPPGAQSDLYERVYFGIAARDNDGYTATVGYLTIQPVSSEKRIQAGGSAITPTEYREVEQDEGLVIDDIAGEVYVRNTADNQRYAYPVGRGGPLLIYPGVSQRVVIQWTGVLGVHYAHASTVQAWYRPRRLTI